MRVISINMAPSKGAPMVSVEEVRALAGRGLVGDRKLDSPKPGGQLTLIEVEAIEALARDYKIEIEPRVTRRNIVTRGVALNHLVGREFKIGEVRVRGVRLCEPCTYLETLTGMKLREGLVHRGGLRADIVSNGVIRKGDEIWTSER